MFIEAELPKYFKDIIEQMRQRGQVFSVSLKVDRVKIKK